MMAEQPAQPAPTKKDECPRTLALYRPGVPMGMRHVLSYIGRVPCTGRLRCYMCGYSPDDETPSDEKA